ncbi:MAG: site-specific integrase [Pseudomonadota bacterium]|nr:site-specific integrase [Pseudomonadota bacterium]
MATITKRIDKQGNTHYQAKVRLKGYPQQTATFSRLTDARRWATQTEAAIRERRHFKTVEAQKHTLDDLVDRYIRDILPSKPRSQAKQTAQLRWWANELGTYTLADVTPALIAECRDKLARQPTRRGPTTNSATIVRYLAALSHAFTVAVKEWGWVEDNPVLKVTKPKESRGRVRFLSDDERKRLLTACRESPSPWIYPVVILALSTGMRSSEIMGLTWERVDLNQGRILLEETKNGERRSVPLAGHALDLLRNHAKVRRLDTSLLWPSHRNPSKPIDLRRPWVNALEAAGIEDFRFHDLRHSAASYMLMNGATIAELAEVLGHKTLQMVKRYSHLSEAHAKGLVERMNEAIFGEVQ